MKIYLAGDFELRREKLFFEFNSQRLMSYYFIQKNKKHSYWWLMQQKPINIFLDSGAFSAWSKNVNIDIQKYIKFIKDNKDILDVYAVLDDITNPEKTLKNQKIMESTGLDPIPCFHYGEPIKYFEYYLDNYDYVALGGMVPVSTKNLAIWLDNLFVNYICDSRGIPQYKIHGFGLTTFGLMRRYPWWSVDSTSWAVSSRTGFVFIPPKLNGQFVYNKNPWRICISKKSPKISDAGQHINNLPLKIKDICKEYFWLKKTTEIKLSEEYIERDLINLKYFRDFELTFSKWPWPFKQRVVTKSFL